MIRLSLLYAYVLFLLVYTWRDWYKALCGLVLMMAVIEHPDMPREMFGIGGLNPFNVVLGNLMLAWFLKRRSERLVWDMPRYINVMLILYLGVIAVGFVRLYRDPTAVRKGGEGRLAEMEEFRRLSQGMSRADADALRQRMFGESTAVAETRGEIVRDFLINNVKFVLPGLLLFDGCRSRRRFLWALLSALGIYFLLGLQVIRWMPPTTLLSGDELADRSLKIILNEVGFHRVNLSMMLGGAAWAIFAMHPLARTPVSRNLTLLASVLAFYAQMLTAGRTGYATWILVGLSLCVIKWRRYLLVIPVAAPIMALLVVILMPGVVERMLEGIVTPSRDDSGKALAAQGLKGFLGENSRIDEYAVTAGRTLIWPFVTAKIWERPIIGWGREAMVRTGLSAFLWRRYLESFPHPHNAYLQLLLDNGLVGFLLVMPFYVVMLRHSIVLFRDDRSPTFAAVGGVSVCLLLALLYASMGSQTFYPREGAVGMWCVFGLMLRVWVQRSRLLARARREALVRAATTPSPGASAVAARTVQPAGETPANPRREAAARAAARVRSVERALWARAS